MTCFKIIIELIGVRFLRSLTSKPILTGISKGGVKFSTCLPGSPSSMTLAYVSDFSYRKFIANVLKVSFKMFYLVLKFQFNNSTVEHLRYE